MFSYIYIIRNSKGRFYTGSTNNLRKRLSQHNQGKSTYTRSLGPWKLVYFEGGINEDDTRSRELFLKSGMGKRHVKNRLKRFLSLTG